MIHPSAIVHSGAKLAPDVDIGPFAIIGEHVEIDSGSSIGSHTVVTGHTRIGKDNRIFHHSVIGAEPQDKKYAGEPTRLEIGDGNMVREFCTFNTGTVQDAGVTRMGNNNWVMAYVHLAHDVQIGNNTTLANNAQFAGHCVVGDFAVVGGITGVHQFCRIGAHAMIGAASLVLADVPPYVMAMGNTCEPHGINSEGLRRRGFSAESINAIRRAYKTLYKSGLGLEEAKQALRALVADHPELALFVEFLDSSKRSIIR
jgi:UDP-N-acetylglucosamine acyltransferase